ncbi:hypothetical protein NEMBOFW57_002929 [Staphylotrichum longicolle]|uniref:Uncharacterized protein n=1 Tax=Staphylotrichum longicolle TaxID=669026 RepID=A0AAD4F506_9PEZI|nr:hypothetical protein NEMBOFW57_002929 [Staphylotrichum longicolle]
MPLSGTIIELLTAENPALDLRRQPSGAVTQSVHYQNLEPDQVLDWPDFTYDNIKAAYGHLFDIGPLHSDAIQDLRGSPGEIEKEAHVDDVVLDWNWRICRHPLKHGAEKIQSDLGVERCDITMRHLGHDSKDPSSDAKAKAPDWCIFLRDRQDPDDEKRIIAVWGDSKCSSKWASDPSRLAARYKANWIWPFRQVLTYCVNNATRYGYILTPEEVVVLRVYEDRVATPAAPWRVQHAAVPWSNSGDGVLTVNLAIWALAMMSLNEGHRPIRNLNMTLPLDVWWEDLPLSEEDTGRRRTKRLRQH